RRDRNGGQRFHLNTSLAVGANAGLDAIAATCWRQLDADVSQLQWMTERDERSRLLGGHDASEPCGLQWIALGHFAGADQRERCDAHGDLALCQRFTTGDRFGADVHHARLTAVVEV